jgi:hypothetical protein
VSDVDLGLAYGVMVAAAVGLALFGMMLLRRGIGLRA